MDSELNDFQTLLDKSVRFHGHLCAGQIIGVKIAMTGLRELGLFDPRGKDRKDLIVFVEIDRCATDAIMTVTGKTPGKRSMKIIDYGKMAATFLHLKTNHAVRVSLQNDQRKVLEQRVANIPQGELRQKAYLESLVAVPDGNLLKIENIRVHIAPCDLPGPPLRTVTCDVCGESILDTREIVSDGQVFCRPCASGKAYYNVI